MANTDSRRGIVPTTLLKRFAERAGTYDRADRCFSEDFEDLAAAGYTTINVPKELGGRGLTLADACREQRRLAYHGPALALGTNLHLYWVGVAADLWRAGDRSLEWILREAIAGEIFDADHAERMRGTHGNDVLLEGRFAPDKGMGRTFPAGGDDAYVVAVFAWALLGFANIYYGMAQRTCDLAVASIKAKSSLGLTGSMTYRPEVRHSIARMALTLAPVGPHLEQLAHEWSTGVDHGAEWPARIVSTKVNAVEACWKGVDLAMELAGGTDMLKVAELERLFRNARGSLFHPANAMLTHEVVGKTALEIDLGAQPRWG